MKIQGYPNPGPGLRLHLNENTGGCSPRVLQAIQAMTAEQIASYPEYTPAVLACATYFNVDPEWVLLTNGLDEGILMMAMGHISRSRLHDAETIIPLPAFDPYPNSTAAVGATGVRVPAPADLSAFQTQAVLDAITPQTKIVFLNTPNNPTGQLIPIDDLVRIAEAASHAIVFIDEAYIEFGGTSFLPRLAAHANVIVGRTFSKAYGLAGMRLGVMIGQAAALDPVRAVTLPFNINAVALTALQAALADASFLPAYAAQVRESRERLYAACRRLGLGYWESAANYVLVRVAPAGSPDAAGIAAGYVAALAAQGVHVRDKSGDPMTPGCLRITTGVREHTDAVIAALESVTVEKPSR
jgi:histidinol-phosphate aminotransferase